MESTLTVEDQLNVRQLLARYPRLMDTRDADGYVDAFAPDAVIEMETGTIDQFREIRGHNEIRAMIEGLFTRGPGTPSRLRHMVGEPVIEPSEKGCRAHSYCVIFRVGSDSPSVASIGEYTDDCVKLDNGRWVFARRRMVFRPFLG
ncbi:MAG: nuclear transport factor 2 family protein [Chloroflexi bacterium]|nr:nuclear transport factor 2 family protein [Chloroflexota bacterium]MBV9894705.1 nuclear transport factor 2 family protein [Chloroflexota bacterium]